MDSKKFYQNAYAVALAVLCAASGIGVLIFAAFDSFQSALLPCVFGLFAGPALAPLFHELGHVAFAKAGGFFVAYCKFFVFSYNADKNKR